MESKCAHYAEVYKDVNRVPNAVSAKILPGLQENIVCIQSTWSSQDFVRMEMNNFSRSHVFDKGNLRTLSTELVTGTNSVVSRAFSKSGIKQAILQEVKGSEEKIFLEIWTEKRKDTTFDLTECKEHGKVIKAAYFKNLVWSSNEKYVLYTAEAKKAKSVSYFKDTSQSKESKEEDKTVKGEEYAYIEDWGEVCVGCHHPVLCVLEIETGQVEVLLTDKVGSDITVGQAIWGPNDESVVYVGFKEDPVRLGIYACTNRKSGIYSINMKSKEIDLITTDENIYVDSLRLHPDGNSLVYMENSAGGPHHKGFKLQKYDWTTKKISTVVDLVDSALGEDFPGIYSGYVPVRCWSEDGKFMYFSTLWRSKTVILSVNVENGQVQKINVGDEFGVSLVLDVFNNLMIVKVSSPNLEPCLVAGIVGDSKVEWKFLDSNTPVQHPDISWKITTLQPTLRNEKYPNLDYEVIIVSPTKREENSPLIMIPHGGPHSGFSPWFSFRTNGLVKLGYTLCMVNYRGSSGFGENNLNSLPGNIGTQDVEDVHNATLYLKGKDHGDGFGDVYLFSGSHGGFLGGHLIGQYPDFYKAVSLINPVMDISCMIGVSDIPDWCWVEGGFGDNFETKSPVTPDQLKCLWEKSPIRYVENVRTPTLFLLGTKDLRVPMVQSIPYYHILKSRNVPVSIYQYDDSHSLLKTPHDGDLFMQTAMWFKKHSSA